MTLVLLPGMDGTGSLFEPFVLALGDEYETITVRYPTHASLGYAELETIARAAIPLERPFVLLGESFSGPIAISIAATCPGQLAGLVLCGTFARNPFPFLAWFKRFVCMLPMRLVPSLMISYFLLGRYSTAALRAGLVRALVQVPTSILHVRIRAILSADVVSKLGAVQVPVLCLRGARDFLVPRTASKLMQQTIPEAQIVELDAPHLVLQVAAAEAARTVRNFISTLSK